MMLSSLSSRLRTALRLGTPGSTSIPLINADGSVVTFPLAVSGGAAGLMNGSQAFSANRWVIVGRGPWGDGTGIPSAATNTGNIFIATDIGTSQNSFGGAIFFSDGANWRPLNGHVLLYSINGTVAAPVATVTTVSGTAQVFVLPRTLLIRARLLNVPGSMLRVVALLRRGAPGASPVSANGIVWLNNTDGAIAGQQLSGIAMGVAAGNSIILDATASMVPGTGYTNTPGTPGVVGQTIDRPLTTTADAYVYFGASGGFEAGATIQLISLSVFYEA